MTEELQLRGLLPSDLGFLLKTWLRTSRTRMMDVDSKTFYREKERELKEAIAGELIDFLVLGPADDNDTILGFVAATKTLKGSICHMVYVKKDFRRNGFAKLMLEAVGNPDTCTEKPPAWAEGRMTYNPLLWRNIL